MSLEPRIIDGTTLTSARNPCRASTVIKRIELVNFMSHKRTVIEPAAGLTVLAGPNNCGKSAFVAALQILCHNENSTYVLKHEEKNCQIIVETDDGHTIEWARKKNGSPKYLINDKPYDRLKGNVPPELLAALRLPKVTSDKSEFDIHFGEQKRPVFLLNDSPKAAAEFFASSSDAIRLVEMQALHKQNLRDAKKEQMRLKSESEAIEAELEQLRPIEKLQKDVEACEKSFYEINLAQEEIESLEKAIERLMATDKQLLLQDQTAACFRLLEEPPKFEDETSLANVISNLDESQRLEELSRYKTEALSELKSPPNLFDDHSLAELVKEIAREQTKADGFTEQLSAFRSLESPPEIVAVTPLESTLTTIDGLLKELDRLSQQHEKVGADLGQMTDQIKTWADSNPVCPTCHSKVEVANLIDDSTHKCGSGEQGSVE